MKNNPMKTMITKQMEKWEGGFGKEYTERNAFALNGLNALYRKDYGITRTKLNQLFIGRLKRNIKVLEVGANVGSQLVLLQKMGFKNLYGIELNSYAVEFSRTRTKNINIIPGSAFDIPFKDNYFDLVFTSGVLIHINPKDIKEALHEIYRCSAKFIWGFEYYADKCTEVIYRGNKNLLWKANFPQVYKDNFPGLQVMKVKIFKYSDNDNMDVMFLLRKNDK